MAHANGSDASSVAVLKDLVDQLFALQSERVQIYNGFSSCYSDYVSSGPNYNFAQYRSRVKLATDNFQRVSTGVRSLSAEMEQKGVARPAVALISQLQEQEKTKLTLTVDWQLKNKSMVDAKRALESASEDVDDSDLRAQLVITTDAEKQTKQRLGEVTQEIADTLQDLRYELEDILVSE